MNDENEYLTIKEYREAIIRGLETDIKLLRKEYLKSKDIKIYSEIYNLSRLRNDILNKFDKE